MAKTRTSVYKAQVVKRSNLHGADNWNTEKGLEFYSNSTVNVRRWADLDSDP